MEAKRSQFVLKLLPSFTDFAFLMPIAYLFGTLGGAKSLLNDCDTGWHIRTGEWILAHGAVPRQDPFSFSKPGDPWFAWEWLSDVLLAWLNAVDGLRAVLLVSIALICATFTLLYLLVRRKSNVVVAIWVTMVAAAASSIHWLARPHLFTLLFLVVFYWGLERVREGRRSAAGMPWFAIFPAITLVWTKLHGGFFVGILMICAYGGGEFLHFLFSGDAEERTAAWSRSKGYFLSAAACAAASLVNPYTYHLHVHMAQYLQNPWNSQHIIEFLSPSFHQPRAIFLRSLAGVGGGGGVVESVEPPVYGSSADRSVGARRAAGQPQHSDFRDCGCAGGGRGDGERAAPRGGSERGRLGSAGGGEVQRDCRADAGKGNGSALAPGERPGVRADDPGILRAESAGEVSGGVRSEPVSPGGTGRAAAGFADAHLHQRRVGRLPDLEPQPGLRRRPERFLRQRFRRQVPGDSARAIRLGKDSRRVPREHDFDAPGRAADRRVEGIQPLARRLRRRQGAGLPVQRTGRGRTAFRRFQRRNRP